MASSIVLQYCIVSKNFTDLLSHNDCILKQKIFKNETFSRFSNTVMFPIHQHQCFPRLEFLLRPDVSKRFPLTKVLDDWHFETLQNKKEIVVSNYPDVLSIYYQTLPILHSFLVLKSPLSS